MNILNITLCVICCILTGCVAYTTPQDYKSAMKAQAVNEPLPMKKRRVFAAPQRIPNAPSSFDTREALTKEEWLKRQVVASLSLQGCTIR